MQAFSTSTLAAHGNACGNDKRPQMLPSCRIRCREAPDRNYDSLVGADSLINLVAMCVLFVGTFVRATLQPVLYFEEFFSSLSSFSSPEYSLPWSWSFRFFGDLFAVVFFLYLRFQIWRSRIVITVWHTGKRELNRMRGSLLGFCDTIIISHDSDSRYASKRLRSGNTTNNQ
jgi:hypothetical protein